MVIYEKDIMSRKEMEEAIEEKDYKINDLKLDLRAKDVEIVRLEIKLNHLIRLFKKLDENHPIRIEALDYLENGLQRN